MMIVFLVCKFLLLLSCCVCFYDSVFSVLEAKNSSNLELLANRNPRKLPFFFLLNLFLTKNCSND